MINTIHFWVDGSFDSKTQTPTWAYIAVLPETQFAISEPLDKNNIILHEQKGNIDEHKESWNVTAELFATIEAIKYAQSQSFSHIVIHYDYIGIEKWVTGEWEAKKVLTRKYKEFVLRAKAHVSIIFEKTKAHGDDMFNNYVDKLAYGSSIRI